MVADLSAGPSAPEQQPEPLPDRGTDGQYERMRCLWAEALYHAIIELRYRRDLGMRRWFECTDRRPPSFHWICNVVGLDPECVRAVVLRDGARPAVRRKRLHTTRASR